jgi:hypothetical protein
MRCEQGTRPRLRAWALVPVPATSPSPSALCYVLFAMCCCAIGYRLSSKWLQASNFELQMDNKRAPTRQFEFKRKRPAARSYRPKGAVLARFKENIRAAKLVVLLSDCKRQSSNSRGNILPPPLTSFERFQPESTSRRVALSSMAGPGNNLVQFFDIARPALGVFASLDRF